MQQIETTGNQINDRNLRLERQLSTSLESWDNYMWYMYAFSNVLAGVDKYNQNETAGEVMIIYNVVMTRNGNSCYAVNGMDMFYELSRNSVAASTCQLWCDNDTRALF